MHIMGAIRSRCLALGSKIISKKIIPMTVRYKTENFSLLFINVPIKESKIHPSQRA
jgi:hypothetical protein